MKLLAPEYVWYFCALFGTFAHVPNRATEAGITETEGIQPLVQAHAHNDYHHKRPLLDALTHGFCSVEADIFLVDDRLLVAHDRVDVRPDRTLESLYLKPLQARARKNGGRVYPNGPTITLLVDIKSDGPSTYRKLATVLREYRDMLTRIEGSKIVEGAVTVIISGNRPTDLIASQSNRLANVDGRLSDLTGDIPKNVMPLISDNWNHHFKWRGAGPIPDDERAKLIQLVKKAHAQDRKIRFWATPETWLAWSVLREAGVDLINTDDLAGLNRLLLEAPR